MQELAYKRGGALDDHNTVLIPMTHFIDKHKYKQRLRGQIGIISIIIVWFINNISNLVEILISYCSCCENLICAHTCILHTFKQFETAAVVGGEEFPCEREPTNADMLSWSGSAENVSKEPFLKQRALTYRLYN